MQAMFAEDGRVRVVALSRLLPDAFGPADLAAAPCPKGEPPGDAR